MASTDDAALDLAAAVGPYFALDRWTGDADWRPLGELAEDARVLTERVSAAREALATRSGESVAEVEERATASIVFLGLAARLVSPAVACAVLADRVPDLRLETLWWKPVDGGPWPLARTADGGAAAGPGDLAEQLDARILVPIVTPLLEAFSDTFSLSEQVLRGNVASSVVGAQAMVAAAHPDRAAAGGRLVARLLQHGTLRGTGDLDGSRPGFVRRSCCLFYRVPGAGLCGDCVLDEAPPAG